VIPVYNGSNYLREAIDGALAQSYRNIEVIVVNDGSDDSGMTEAIARSYGVRIRYFCKENGGVATALNYGISQMTGEYFSWLSHDDVYFPEKVERQVSAMAVEDEKTVLYSDFEVIDWRSRHLNYANIRDVEPQDVFYRMMTVALHMNGCTLLIPRACFEKVGLFDESLRTTQDYHMWFRMMKSGYKFKLIPEPLVKWRLHPTQGVQANKDACYREQEQLYIWAFDLFQDEVSSYSYVRILKMALGLRGYGKVNASDYVLRSRHPALYPLSKAYCVIISNSAWIYLRRVVSRVEIIVSRSLNSIGLGFIVRCYRRLLLH